MATPTRAIIFSGAGAYGAYEVGVLNALAECGWSGPQIVGGASAGAINAALLAGSHDVSFADAARRLENLWLQRIAGHFYQVRGDPRSMLIFAPGPYLSAAAQWFTDVESLSINFGKRFLQLGAGGFFDARLLQLVDLSSFISIGPLERLLHEIIDPAKLRESPVKLSVMATNWCTGQAQVFNNERMTDADAISILLASATIPGFFPPRKVGDSVYVDGSLVMNAPLQPAIDDGADEIHVIYLDPDVAKVPLRKLQNTFDTLDRVLAMNVAFHINSDIDKARQVNRAMAIFNGGAASEAGPKVSDVAGLVAQWERACCAHPPRKLTIHRHRPRHDLGGLLGLLRFEKNAIEELIGAGYKDTKAHDCAANGCERPDAAMASSEA